MTGITNSAPARIPVGQGVGRLIEIGIGHDHHVVPRPPSARTRLPWAVPLAQMASAVGVEPTWLIAHAEVADVARVRLARRFIREQTAAAAGRFLG